LKVRDLYSLRQVSAMKIFPVPAKFRVKILVIAWVENVSETTVVKVHGSA
jgi:hypothetical protein